MDVVLVVVVIGPGLRFLGLGDDVAHFVVAITPILG